LKAFNPYHLLFTVILFIQSWQIYAFVGPSTKSPNTIRIIENKGQWESQVLFKANISSGNVFITKQGIAYSLYDESSLHQRDHDWKNIDSINRHHLKVDFVNSNTNPTIIKQLQSAEYYNYFIGSDQSKWKNHCYAYEKIVIQNIYYNTDLEFVAQENSFKINFIVHPGGDPSNIKIKYTGANQLALYSGALNIFTSVGILKEEKPICMQGESNINSNFVLNGDVLSYHLSSYNKNADLVIDPTVIFGTYSASLADNWGFTATYDKNGNAYSGGTVYDTGFPVTYGAYQTIYKDGVTIGGEDLARDAGILKYSNDGTQLLFATYLGGTNNEQPHSMICDNSGNLIIMGTTNSTNFPTTTGSYDRTQNGMYDFFVCKLSYDGTTLIGSTFVGGSKDDGINSDSTHLFYNPTSRPLTYNYGDQFRGEVMIDSATNSIFVASTTHSSSDNGFPIVNGFQTSYGGGYQDGCLFKLNSSLTSLLFCTYIGGSGSDAAYGVTFDNSGNIFVCGGTSSSDLPYSGGTQFSYHGGTDGFIAKISPYGNSLTTLIYVGTSVYDQAQFIQIDNQQNIYITGQSNGAFPVSTGVYKNIGGKQYIAVYDRNLTTLKISTVFGTGRTYPDISPSAFLVDVCGRVYVSGWGGKVNGYYNIYTGDTKGLPITANATQKTTDGSDFYVIVLSKDLKSLSYATFYGGSLSNEHVDGGTSRFDKNGMIYQSVCGGCGGNSDFPTTTNAYSRVNKSSNCNNALFKILLNVSEFPPVFNDTLIKVIATDLISLPFMMTDQDGDSIFYTYSGSIFNLLGNPATISKNIGAGTSRGTLNWQTACSDVSSDTITITLNLVDNGCPISRTSVGKIKILVQPIPPITAPFPQCLKTINDSTVKLEWQNNSNSKYFKSYNIYRKKNENNFQLVSTINNPAKNYFIDSFAMMHVINNYCYFITTTNICDIVADSSRTICSLFKNDTSTTPVFTFIKDTIIKIYAFDTLNYTTTIGAIDPKDSVYIQCMGSMIGSSKLLSLQIKNNLSVATLTIKWNALCDGLNSTDTPYLRFYAKDNQCPSPRTINGMIRVLVIPAPQNIPTLHCIKFINENAVEIKWDSVSVNKFFNRFVVLKKSIDGTIKPITSVSNSKSFSYQDNTALKNLITNYCYAVTAQDKCNLYADTSAFKCTVRQPSDFPSPSTFYTVTVQDNKNIAMFWRKSIESNFLTYTVYKRLYEKPTGGTSVFSGNNLTDTTFIDNDVKVQEHSYCYTIAQSNECGLQSEFNPEACSILLKGQSNPFENSLKWNGYNYWIFGLDHYDIMRTEPNKNPENYAQTLNKDTQQIDGNLNYDNGIYYYQIVANESVKGTGITSTSNKIELIQQPLLHVPNAFTPNDDSLNDSWNVVPVFVKDYYLKIYDRWGKMVFESSDKKTQFKGITQSGEFATCDVFVYVITYTGFDDVAYTAKGNLTILK